MTLSAQKPSQWEKRERTEENKKPHYATWAVGADFGLSSTFMDMYSAEANGESNFSGRGSLLDFGAGIRIEKWYTSMFGMQGQAAWLQMTGTKKEYGFQTPSYRLAFNLLFQNAFP